MIDLLYNFELSSRHTKVQASALQTFTDVFCSQQVRNEGLPGRRIVVEVCRVPEMRAACQHDVREKVEYDEDPPPVAHDEKARIDQDFPQVVRARHVVEHEKVGGQSVVVRFKSTLTENADIVILNVLVSFV